MNNEYVHPNRFLRIWAVKKMIGLSKTKIYDMQAKGTFPHSYELGGRSVGWLETEVHGWMNQRSCACAGGFQPVP
jgi:prophage regulatory protein